MPLTETILAGFVGTLALGGGASYLSYHYAQEAESHFGSDFPNIMAILSSKTDGIVTYSEAVKIFNAYTHAYVSGRFSQTVGTEIAKFLGDLNELHGLLRDEIYTEDSRKDQWNNDKGRQLSDTHTTETSLADALAVDVQAYLDNQFTQLVYDEDADTRAYFGVEFTIASDAWDYLKEHGEDFLANFGAIRKAVFTNLDITHFVNNIHNLFDYAENYNPDPLVLDLNGDGQIALNPAATVYFDMDQDGFAEAVNWVGASDGFLVYDVNENGNIDDSSELFGNATQDGFSVLSFYDSNYDRVINASDSIWADLLVWQDLNQDGYSQSNELLTLSSLGIISINLNSVVDSNETGITHNGIVTTTTGTMKISNVVFEADNVNTRYIGEYTLDIDTLFLPTLRGHGSVMDLHIAASINTSQDINGDTIKDKLVQLAGMDLLDLATDMDGVKETVRTIIYQWAEVDNATEYSRGPYVRDAKPLLFLEKYLNEQFRGVPNSSSNPGVQQGKMVDGVFEKALEKFTADIIVQIAARELFETSPYEFAEDGIDATKFVLSASKLADLADYASGLADTAARADFWKGIANIIHIAAYGFRDEGGRNTFGLTSAEELKLNTAIEESDPDLTWYKEDHVAGVLTSIEYAYFGFGGADLTLSNAGDTYTGSALDDRIIGGTGNDTINGSAGHDLLYGHGGDDIISGGTGNDRIYGDNNIYSVQGNDIIYGGDGNDTIFGDMGNDEIYGGDGDDVLFGDMEGGAEANHIPNDLDDIIDGGLGNDHLIGGYGDDILIDGYGSTGQNLMDGGNGYNTYRIVGGGAEVWIESGDGVLEIPAAYTDENDLQFTRDGDMLHITGTIPGSEINVYIVGAFNGLFIDNINFASSYTYDLHYQIDLMLGNPTIFDDVLYSANRTPSNTHQDIIYAMSGNDIVFGDGGNDLLYGQDGNDTLHGENGDDQLSGDNGNDILYGGSGNDYLLGGTGDDLLNGGADNDSLIGGTGNDTYIYLSGDGNDGINEEKNEGFDTLSLTDIASTSARLWVSYSGVVSMYIGSSIITINASRTNVAGTEGETDVNQRLERIIFSDNVELSLTTNLILTGSSLGEYGYGSQFADTIHGMDGNDILYGNRGDDALYGDDGDDNLYGGDGDDTLYGGDGNDSLSGGNGHDILYGGNGIDSLYGDAGDDILNGGENADSLRGGAGNDIYLLSGSFGDDQIGEYTGEGDDTVVFTDVASTSVRMWIESAWYSTSLVIYTASGTVKLDGGITNFDGTNFETNISTRIESVEFSDNVTFSLTSGLILTGSNNAEYGYGSQYADTIHGMEGGDIIYGNRGDDTIYGDDGNDALNGGDGNDVLYGGTGNDSLYGDNGNDILNGGEGADSLNGGAGNDTYLLTSGHGNDSINEYTGEGDDTIVFTDVTSTSVRMWTEYSGSLLIYTGTDIITLGGSRTNASGTNGETNIGSNIENIEFSDNVTVSLTAGLILTGSSLGEYGYGSQFADTIHGMDGNDTIYGNRGNDIIYGDGGIDSLYGGDGHDTLYGGDGGDYIFAENGDDILDGGDGNDNLWGDDGNDVIEGGSGNDGLYGGAGDDILSGQAGSDTLYGDGGSDTFKFEVATAFSGSDTIMDFKFLDNDKIDISDLLQNYDPLTHAITDFVEITDNGTDSFLKIDIDGGANNFVQIATIKNVTGLTDEAALVLSGNMIV